ncbi:MAG: type II toxin-antitoxin system HicA family toxin [bacterium]
MDPIKDLIKAALAQGWRVDTTTRGHLRFWPLDKSLPPSISSGTPGDWRAVRNLLADLRRKGFKWPWPPQHRGE